MGSAAVLARAESGPDKWVTVNLDLVILRADIGQSLPEIQIVTVMLVRVVLAKARVWMATSAAAELVMLAKGILA